MDSGDFRCSFPGRVRLDEGMFAIILQRNYWVALVFGTVIGLLGVYLVYCATKWLDERYDWHAHTLVRTALQILLGWMLPCIAMFLLAAGYFAFFRTNILETDYLKLDLPLIVILMLVMNVYYLCYYLVWHNQQLQDNVNHTQSSEPDDLASRNIFIVNTATKAIPVKTEDIRQIFILEGNTFLRTTDMQGYQDAYLITETLKTMEELLDSRLFIRINRKMIVHIDSVEAFVPGKNQPLELKLSPPFYTGKAADMSAELKKLHIVSEDRMPLFKKWMER